MPPDSSGKGSIGGEDTKVSAMNTRPNSTIRFTGDASSALTNCGRKEEDRELGVQQVERIAETITCRTLLALVSSFRLSISRPRNITQAM